MGPGVKDVATQTDSPSCCAMVLSQLQAVQQELSEARRQLQGALGSSLQPASPQSQVPERDPLELPSCTKLTCSSNLRILGETIEQTEAPAGLGLCPLPLLVKREPADEEPSSGPPPRLVDLPCKEELTDDLQPSDNVHLQPASPQSQVPERDPLELPSCSTLTGFSNLRILGEGWAEYAPPIKGEGWEPPAEEDLAQEAGANDPVLLAPHAVSKLQLENDTLAGSRAAPTALVQQQLHDGTNCDQNFVSKDHVCKQIIPKTQPFNCEKCGAQFTNRSNFHDHTRTHTREGQPKCKVCGKYLSQASSLSHTCTHINTGEKKRRKRKPSFKCEVCRKAFKRSDHLISHNRTHTNKKPFKCNVCQKAFKHSSNLIRHTRAHTGERPFKCEVCGKAFKRSEYLIKHTRTHTGVRAF